MPVYGLLARAHGILHRRCAICHPFCANENASPVSLPCKRCASWAVGTSTSQPIQLLLTYNDNVTLPLACTNGLHVAAPVLATSFAESQGISDNPYATVVSGEMVCAFCVLKFLGCEACTALRGRLAGREHEWVGLTVLR